MSKGDQTRDEIITEATRVASTLGLEGVTIGGLARSLELSKSGLFAHFRSKERLQVAIVEAAADQFSRQVVRPALGEPRGEPRVRALWSNWLAWASSGLPGGCIFVSGSTEFDDRPGPVRDVLASKQREWLQVLAHSVALARREGHFAAGIDPEQVAFEAYGLMLSAHLAHRLLDDTRALDRARTGLDALAERCHP